MFGWASTLGSPMVLVAIVLLLGVPLAALDLVRRPDRVHWVWWLAIALGLIPAVLALWISLALQGNRVNAVFALAVWLKIHLLALAVLQLGVALCLAASRGLRSDARHWRPLLALIPGVSLTVVGPLVGSDAWTALGIWICAGALIASFTAGEAPRLVQGRAAAVRWWAGSAVAAIGVAIHQISIEHVSPYPRLEDPTPWVQIALVACTMMVLRVRPPLALAALIASVTALPWGVWASLDYAPRVKLPQFVNLSGRPGRPDRLGAGHLETKLTSTQQTTYLAVDASTRLSDIPISLRGASFVVDGGRSSTPRGWTRPPAIIREVAGEAVVLHGTTVVYVGPLNAELGAVLALEEGLDFDPAERWTVQTYVTLCASAPRATCELRGPTVRRSMGSPGR